MGKMEKQERDWKLSRIRREIGVGFLTEAFDAIYFKAINNEDANGIPHPTFDNSYGLVEELEYYLIGAKENRNTLGELDYWKDADDKSWKIIKNNTKLADIVNKKYGCHD